MHRPGSRSARTGGTCMWLDGGGSVAVFSRNAATGALSQLAGEAACVAAAGDDEDGNPLPCTVAAGLNSPPGKSGQQAAVVVSPNGKNVYVASYQAVATFSRSASSGALSQAGAPAGCVAAQDAITQAWSAGKRAAWGSARASSSARMGGRSPSRARRSSLRIRRWTAASRSSRGTRPAARSVRWRVAVAV